MSEEEPEREMKILYVTAEEYDWLLTRLDEPPREMPHLRALLQEHRDG